MPKWLRRRSADDELEKRLAQMQGDLSLLPEQVNIDNLVPVLAPAEIFAFGNWPGPFAELFAAEVALTWATLQPEQTMLYVSHQLATYWEAKNTDWKTRAFDNLIRISIDLPWTHELRSKSGRIFLVAMFHPDGVGPSRLLLSSLLDGVFPAGYRIAIPERSCGLAFVNDLSPAEAEQVEGLVTECFEKGSNPVSIKYFDPGDFRIR